MSAWTGAGPGSVAGVGVDFGTTNSAVAVCFDAGAASGSEPRTELARFADASGLPEADDETRSTFRSILYFERDPDAPEGAEPVSLAGPPAIRRYLEADEPGRLIQSLKSFLAARDFSTTRIFGKTIRLEAMVGLLLRQLREQAERTVGELRGPVVVGRPVRFASSSGPQDDALAMERLRVAFRSAGYGEIEFEYEPVAAAYHYARGLDRDELILIGDFGGGTSDFCLLRIGPAGTRAARGEGILGTEGVALAGDAFDGRIVRHAVAPLLGLGRPLRSMLGKEQQAPLWVYAHLQRWHHLSFLRTRKSMQVLHDLCREAVDPEPFRALLHLVGRNLGFELHRAIEQTKREMSSAREGRLDFCQGPIAIDEGVPRADFTSWIWDDLQKIDACVERLLEQTGVPPERVDRVFLTGGSSFVPAVRGLFVDRFGRDKLRSGQELTSVATGLALRARELARPGAPG